MVTKRNQERNKGFDLLDIKLGAKKGQFVAQESYSYGLNPNPKGLLHVSPDEDIFSSYQFGRVRSLQ
jgi:hypothetical protein